MENLNYKLIMWVKQLNLEVVQFLCGLYDIRGMGCMCKIEGKMIKALYLNIIQDEVMKSTEWYIFSLFNVIFQHDNDLKHTAKSVKQWLPNFDVLTWHA
jgi:hypothetical protein